MPVSMVTTKPSELFSSVPPCLHCGANRIFELQFMPALIGNLKLAKQTCANLTGDLSSQNNKHEAETEQFSNSNNVHNLGRLDNNICEDNGGNLSDNTGLREDQRKAFLATVNQVNDVVIEFGTVMVFTCAKSCWGEKESVREDVYLEEFCLVEVDPDVLLFQ